MPNQQMQHPPKYIFTLNLVTLLKTKKANLKADAVILFILWLLFSNLSRKELLLQLENSQQHLLHLNLRAKIKEKRIKEQRTKELKKIREEKKRKKTKENLNKLYHFNSLLILLNQIQILKKERNRSSMRFNYKSNTLMIFRSNLKMRILFSFM